VVGLLLLLLMMMVMMVVIDVELLLLVLLAAMLEDLTNRICRGTIPDLRWQSSLSQSLLKQLVALFSAVLMLEAPLGALAVQWCWMCGNFACFARKVDVRKSSRLI